MDRDPATDLIAAAEAQMTAILLHLDERLTAHGSRVTGVVFFRPAPNRVAVTIAAFPIVKSDTPLPAVP